MSNRSDRCIVRLEVDIQFNGGESNVRDKYMNQAMANAISAGSRPQAGGSAPQSAAPGVQKEQAPPKPAYVPKEPVTNRLKRKAEESKRAVLVSGASHG